MGFTGVYSAAEVVIGVIEARDDAEVVIGLVMGVDRHFCELLVVCRIEVSGWRTVHRDVSASCRSDNLLN
jgi:hypothetical protein